MCGVIGFYSPSPKAADINDLRSLFVQSKVRGLHSFGFSYFSKSGGIETRKAKTVEEINKKLSKMELGKSLALIGHNRYSTSGDWVEYKNNQPLVANGVALAFNGVISMETKAQWEQKYRRAFETDNDGEIFLNWVGDGGDPIEFLKYTPCSFAGLYLQGEKVLALRNKNRPLWMLQRRQGLFLASTADIFQRAFGNCNPTEVPPLKLIDLEDVCCVKS